MGSCYSCNPVVYRYYFECRVKTHRLVIGVQTYDRFNVFLSRAWTDGGKGT